MTISAKELTEQAFGLYRNIQELKRKPGISSHKSKRLSYATDTALKRYERRLKKWWATK
ncbi:MAG: hypothetical protein QX199_18440 [Methylococcaceae bacterium]